LVVLISALLGAGSHALAGGTPLTTVRVANGLSKPLFAGAPPGDLQRVFIEEQTGRIKILKGGAVLSTPFLDIHTKITTAGNEQGLLGLAFHPNYAQNGFFYVNYTRAGDGATVVERYHVSADPDVADPTSAFVIITIAQPFENHNGGMLGFGPNDGYLYMGMGDGGSANDPNNNAQNPAVLLGKMLRIDVDGGSPYVSPPSNPFFGPGDPRDEIWALGTRNPWRWSFDRLTGDLWIADVGQDAHEEIDFQPASSGGGENYGWRCMEGFSCTGLTGCTCNGPALTLPIYDYPHGAECSVTGGYVYRGCAVPDLQGTYFFADYCSAKIWSLRYDGTTITEFTDRTAELDPPGGETINSVTSFGEDGLGEMYICDQGGELFKIVPVVPASSWSNYGTGWPGTNGIPGYTLSADPDLCAVVTLVLGNSRGATTPAFIAIGAAPASAPTVYDGTFLVVPSVFIPLSLPAGGLSAPFTVPCDPAMCGASAYSQAFEMDPGASKGVSFTAGLKITIGPSG
jgi:glucose/arabinose dehydrogenase